MGTAAAVRVGWTRWTSFWAFWIGVASVGGPACAQKVFDVKEQDGSLVFSFDELNGTSMRDFVAMYQKLTGKVIQYDIKDLPGEDQPGGQGDVKIWFFGRKLVPRNKLDLYFGAVLRSLDYLLIQIGSEEAGFLSLRKLGPQAGRGAFYKTMARIVTAEELDLVAENPGLLVTTSLTTHFILARDAVATLAPYFQDGAAENIRNIENTNTILVTGFANTLVGVRRLIKEIDTKPEDYYPEVVHRPLKHAVADEIQPVLEELLQAFLGEGRGGGAARQRQQGGPTGIEIEPSVIAEGRTNSLIVVAAKETLEKVLSWIDQLDRETDPRGDIHVYRLRNSRAEELADTLEAVMEGTERRSRSRSGGAGAGAGQPGGGQGGTGASGARPSGEQPVSIIPDVATNSLVITASKTRYAQILEIINKLDVRPAQVLIQAALIELSESLGEALGAEVTLYNTDSEEDSFFGLSTFGLTELIDTDGDGFPDTKGLPEELANGLTGGIFDPEDFALPFVISALKNQSEANVLSMPTILTNDNQPATIRADDQVPFTSTNQGQNSDQTSLGGTEDAGITLEISPTISAGGYLRLAITLTISAFSGSSADPNLPPPKLERFIEASVTIPDGHTMVIGGVLTDDYRRDEAKVPILGDLPLIGFLFRNTSTNAKKTNLYIFLTPHIIADDFASLDELTRLHVEEAERLGGQVQFLDRFNLIDDESPKVSEESERLLEELFEMPSYSSVSDLPSQGPTSNPNVSMPAEKMETEEK